MKHVLLIFALLCFPLAGVAQRVSVHAVDEPAAAVFRSIIEQTGLNFVYSSEVLRNVKISVDAKDKPVKKVLHDMFRDTDIEYSVKGKNVILRRKEVKKEATRPTAKARIVEPLTEPPIVAENLLDELVVVSRLEAPAVETAEIGATKVTAEQVRRTPALFGESDVIKALHTQPGVTEGTEGMAGMHVHGGSTDENLYMLDNVPLYQVNHFAGFFSAFNTDIIRYIDFFKTSFPAKYDGRLSSFMDVRLLNGGREGHHGSARIGLTSGAFNITGPIGGNTSYLVGLRRSWFDVITIPIIAMVNINSDEKTRFHYYFMDANAKVTHKFNDRLNCFVSVYFGDDMIRTGTEDESSYSTTYLENDKYDLHWGNLVAQTGMNYRFNPTLSAEFTAAYTRFFSGLKHQDKTVYFYGETPTLTHEKSRTDNNINDWIFRGDFDWQPADEMRVRFGGNYTRHSFLPSRTIREFIYENDKVMTRDSTWAYHANEVNAYIEDDWRIGEQFHINAGLHTSLFEIEGKVKYGLSPRLSFNWRLRDDFAVKAAYSRTTQYVHQLAQSYLALPTDQWIPVTGNFKPQTADKIALGGYWHTRDNAFAVSVEAYYKWMRNLLEYRDEYYLSPPFEMWNSRLTTGRGTSKGIDFKVEKLNGRVTGHIAYSLAWADRTFAHKNGGRTYPARFDNRHTINIVVNWKISKKVQFNASWTGHSGNRFTLLPQVWEPSSFGSNIHFYTDEGTPLQAPINNYQLPFFHRLDLSLDVRNRRGYWTIGLYNAYNHMNTIAVRRSYRDMTEYTPNGVYHTAVPVFQKVKLLPILPSISYTWQF